MKQFEAQTTDTSKDPDPIDPTEVSKALRQLARAINGVARALDPKKPK